MHAESTVLELPSDLMAAIDQMVREGRARTRDELIETLLRRELAQMRRSAIDAEFLLMAGDTAYQMEACQILAEFAGADRETLPAA